MLEVTPAQPANEVDVPASGYGGMLYPNKQARWWPQLPDAHWVLTYVKDRSDYERIREDFGDVFEKLTQKKNDCFVEGMKAGYYTWAFTNAERTCCMEIRYAEYHVHFLETDVERVLVKHTLKSIEDNFREYVPHFRLFEKMDIEKLSGSHRGEGPKIFTENEKLKDVLQRGKIPMPTFGTTHGNSNDATNALTATNEKVEATHALTATNEEVEATNGLTTNNSKMDTEDGSAYGDATDAPCSGRPTGQATTGQAHEKSAVAPTAMALIAETEHNVSKRFAAGTDERTHVKMLIAAKMEILFQLQDATDEQSKREEEQLLEHENTKSQYHMSQKENVELKRKLDNLQTQHEGKIAALMQKSSSSWEQLEKNFQDSLDRKTAEIAELRGSITELRSLVTVTEQANKKLKEDLQTEQMMNAQLRNVLANRREMMQCAQQD